MHNVLCEMVSEHQDIGDLRQSVQLQGLLYSRKVYMQEVHRSQWPKLGVEALLVNCPHVASNMYRTRWIVASD